MAEACSLGWPASRSSFSAASFATTRTTTDGNNGNQDNMPRGRVSDHRLRKCTGSASESCAVQGWVFEIMKGLLHSNNPRNRRLFPRGSLRSHIDRSAQLHSCSA